MDGATRRKACNPAIRGHTDPWNKKKKKEGGRDEIVVVVIGE